MYFTDLVPDLKEELMEYQPGITQPEIDSVLQDGPPSSREGQLVGF